MTTKFPTEGIQNLILNNKGDRSYEDLARGCGGEMKSRALHSAATKQSKGFADPETIRGLSRGLNVPIIDIIRAYAISLGLPVITEDPLILRIVGGGSLPQSGQQLLLSVARDLQRAYEAPAASA
ncbi:hypothetical protein [Arthrobacter sp. Ld5]|uniref:hypothetical protein n=1 Tax=Arthrobacter sp. Ld5 TaxID=649152 RepID=UPI003EBF9590